MDIPVIGSLNGISLGGLFDHARLIEQAGAAGVILYNLFYQPDIEIDAAVESGRPCPHSHVTQESPRPNTFCEAFHQLYREKLAAMILAEVLAYESNPNLAIP